MFTAGRILGKKAGSRAAERTSIFGDQWSTAVSHERRKFRCYVPFVWQSVLATVAGFIVMAAGASLCIVGFYTGHQPQPQSEVRQDSNDTQVFTTTLRIFAYFRSVIIRVIIVVFGLDQ